MSEKFSGVRIVTALAVEMKDALLELCGPKGWFDSQPRWLARGANKAGISPRTAKTLFYQEAARPHVETVEKVRAARQAQQEAKAREEYAELSARIAAIEARLAQTDEDFHRPSIDGLREATSPMGRVDRAVD